MNPLTFDHPQSIQEAVFLGQQPGAEYIAGGTDMVQLLKDDVRHPRRLIDLDALDLANISVDQTGLKIGALARLADVSDHPQVKENYPVIAEALFESASPQIRNLATIGGNLLQRTRCTYFRDNASACNKRAPGTGCSAIQGINRMHAIFGGGPSCVATHPSDLAVALVALDAVVHVSTISGNRDILLSDLYQLPESRPDQETVLKSGDLITGVSIPAAAWTRRSTYLKVRDRATFEFALVSTAVALDVKNGEMRSVRIAAGGVGTRPWRLLNVEKTLTGAQDNERSWAAAAEAADEGAQPLGQNGFKTTLLKNTVARALAMASAKA